MDPVTLATAAGVAGWLSGVVGSFLAIRTELRWLRSDVDKHDKRLGRIDEILRNQGAM